MKTELEKKDDEIKALKTLLVMSEAHKEALIAMHEAEKKMIIHAKSIGVRFGEFIIGENSKTED